ncbi:efflux RND transporter periplasmic adaptor subunit [Pectobacterium carotovorum]|uniref:efflux RND transporter periplasmic adaptor subunit n=1 Tax=Pectobacterium carotovorum TaxID=554 RepID=UPI0030198B64
MKRYKFIFYSFLMIFPFLSACDQHSEKGVPLRQVVWCTAMAPPEVISVFAGTIQSSVETELAFRTLGRVISRKVDVGDIVRKGDVLAEIDALSLKQSVINAEAQLLSSQAILRNAVLTEKRKRVLSTTFAISAAEYDLAEQALKAAQADVEKSQANLDKAREQLGYTTLNAEFDGVITSTLAEIGQTVGAGQTVLKLSRLDQRDAVIDVPGLLLPTFITGEHFSVSLQLDDTISTTGIIREVGPEADSSTRTHRVKISIDNAPEIFRIGALVKVSADSLDPEENTVVVLPVKALFQNSDKGGQARVWVIDPDKNTVSLRSIMTESYSANAAYIRVLQGVRVGEKVVASGVDNLSEGQKIVLGQRTQ